VQNETFTATQAAFKFLLENNLSLHSLTQIMKLTPWNKVFLEKLIVTQLVKILPTFYEIQRSITVFTRAHYWLLS
jgi:hypothetical protein